MLPLLSQVFLLFYELIRILRTSVLSLLFSVTALLLSRRRLVDVRRLLVFLLLHFFKESLKLYLDNLQNSLHGIRRSLDDMIDVNLRYLESHLLEHLLFVRKANLNQYYFAY